jgi:hypothetical protein
MKKIFCLLCAGSILVGNSLGFSLETPKEFALLPAKERSSVLKKTWSERQKIMEGLKEEGFEKPEEQFFHVYHQMLIIDGECLQKEASKK